MPRMIRTLLVLAVFSPFLAACTQIKQVTNKIAADWDEQFGEPDPAENPDSWHIYNFDTFICDGARQLVVSFNPNGTKASIMFEEKQLLMTRDVPVLPFVSPPYAIYIMEDGTLLLEKHFDVIYKHCKPLVNDPVKKTMVETYEFTPTATPEEMKADKIFREQMKK